MEYVLSKNWSFMMSDPRLSTLFRWGVENSAVATSTDGSEQTSPKQQLDPQMLAALLSGPSDADLMQEAIKAVHSSDFDIDQKIIALTNFRDLIEGIDNANNVDKLKLWSPLLELLKSEERRIRLMAASCVSSAVQNNEKCQKEVSIDLNHLRKPMLSAGQWFDEGIASQPRRYYHFSGDGLEGGRRASQVESYHCHILRRSQPPSRFGCNNPPLPRNYPDFGDY